MDPEKTPHLVIFLEVERIPLKAHCSHCKDIIFTTGDDIGTAEEQHSKLENLFREHFRKVHMKENTCGHAANE